MPELFSLVWLIGLIGLMVFCLKLISDEKYLRKTIQLQNEIRGVETKITSKTIKWAKITALFGLLVGTVMLLAFISNLSVFNHL